LFCNVRRAYTFRLRPTARQHVALGRCLASHRELYNAALQERRDAWRLKGIGGSYGDQSAQLKEIRKVRPDVAAWSFSSQLATLRRLNRAFAGFSRRVKAGQTPGYPRFKHLKVTVHRRVDGRVKTIQVRRQGRRWMLVLSCDEVPTRPRPPTQAAVGIDVGIASFATTSDGQHVSNPRVERAAAARLASSQQVLARKQQGSNHRAKARATLAARHRKLANQRRNFHHHLARALITRYDLLVIEDLKVHRAKAEEARNILRAGLARLAATPAA
jgi:putative transposase